MRTPPILSGALGRRLLATAAALLSGCSQALPPAEYRAFLADPKHGLVQTREAAGVTATAAYVPAPVLVLRELAHLTRNTPAVRDSLTRSYAGKAYCTLSMTPPRGGNRERLGQ